MKRSTLVLALALATLSSRAAAEPAAAAPPPSPLAWRDEWRKPTGVDVLVAAVGVAGTIVTGFVLSEPPKLWEGRNALDEGGRDLFRSSSDQARQTQVAISDVLFYGVAAYPLIVDAGVVALVVHRDARTAGYLAIGDFLSLGTAGTFAGVIERSGRERPYRRNCGPGGPGDPDCDGPGPNTSFLSGHTAAAFAGAGLVCVQHKMLPLYGGRFADGLACGSALTLATTSAVFRLTGDQHYVTDVLAGTALGLTAGYVLPSLLYFGFSRPPPAEVVVTGSSLVVRGTW